MRHCLKLGELRLHARLGEADEGSLVAHLVAVVRRAEDGYALSVVLLDEPAAIVDKRG